jgi:hypothetical protein
LANIAEFYNAPITPMHGIEPGILERLRKTDPDYFQFNTPISADKISVEILKWA